MTAQLASTQVSTHAFPLGYKGAGIGVYFTETGCPAAANISSSWYTQGSTCNNGEQPHPTGVALTLHAVAPEASIFGFDQLNRPNPTSVSPVIRIGSHSWASYTERDYSSEDQAFDNYVYNSRVTLFNASGNAYYDSLKMSWNYNVHNRGVNEITVGAHCVGLSSTCNGVTDGLAWYSTWINANQGAEKPEIITPTDLSLPIPVYNNVFGGTSASTPFAAGIAADIMEEWPGSVGYPEVIKAIMVAGSKSPIVFNNGSNDKKVGSAGYLRYSSFLSGNLRAERFEANNAGVGVLVNEKKTITSSSIEANKQYRVAIAWLNQGDFVMANQSQGDGYTLNMDFDLKIYQNGVLIASSTSWNSSYEVVDFVPTSSANISIEMSRYWNSGVGKVILAYALVEGN